MTDPLFARFGREFPIGEVLFREGETGAVMYIVQSGVVRVSKRVGAEDKTIAFVNAGDFVGEMAILNGKPRSATATVVQGPARCLVIEAGTLELMVSKNAEIAMRLIKKLARRLDSADALVEVLMQRDPKARLLLSLIRLTEGCVPDQSGLIEVPTTPAEIANQVGVEADEAEDLFARLRRLRLVEDGPDGRIVVRSLERLEDFFEFLSGSRSPA